MGQHRKRISFLEGKKYTLVINVSGNKKKKSVERRHLSGVQMVRTLPACWQNMKHFSKYRIFIIFATFYPFFKPLYFFFYLFYLFNVHIYSATHVNIKSIVKKKV